MLFEGLKRENVYYYKMWVLIHVYVGVWTNYRKYAVDNVTMNVCICRLINFWTTKYFFFINRIKQLSDHTTNRLHYAYIRYMNWEYLFWFPNGSPLGNRFCMFLLLKEEPQLPIFLERNTYSKDDLAINIFSLFSIFLGESRYIPTDV